MKTHILKFLFQICWIQAVIAEPIENPLERWAEQNQPRRAVNHPSISVTAYLKDFGGKHILAFKFTNLSNKTLKLYPHELPWGNPHSITIAAITTKGRYLSNLYPIADPEIQEKITIAPGASKEGDYDIGQIVQLSEKKKSEEIIVIWSYKSPEEPKNSPSICTGVVAITK